MTTPKPPTLQPPKHFTAFRSVAEEAATSKIEQEGWDNEGGHMSSTGGQIVQTPGSAMPYKVVLTRDGGGTAERSFATMREAEAFIRRNTPVPAARRTLYDRAANET